MKIHDVKDQVTSTGEFILGAEQTGSHACYLIYGTMKPSEKERKLKAGKGHEEIFLAIKGTFLVTSHPTGDDPVAVSRVLEGQAFHITGDDAYRVDNVTESSAIYVMAGGHSSHGHHESSSPNL